MQRHKMRHGGCYWNKLKDLKKRRLRKKRKKKTDKGRKAKETGQSEGCLTGARLYQVSSLRDDLSMRDGCAHSLTRVP